jgi:subtilisin family serine protease
MHRGSVTAAIAAIAVLLTALSAFGAPAAVAAPGPAQAPEWWFDAWRVPSLWAEGAKGTGIVVGLIDTGVQASIPELQGQVLPGADYIGNGSDGRTDFDSDQFSHGTAMASLIAAKPGYADIEGVAPGAKILPIAVPLSGTIQNGTPTPNATPLAIRYAADHGAKIISMSLGKAVYQGVDSLPCPQDYQDAIAYAINKGALVVAASGNSGANGNPVEEPGVCLGVISVGAVSSNRQTASFSSRHPYLTVAAPGDVIATLSKIPGLAFIGGGTSQATAITAGALALIWSRYPTESNQQIASRLLNTVDDLGPKGRDTTYGLGLIDPAAAIASTSAANQPNPVFTAVRPLLVLAAQPDRAPRALPPAGSSHAALGTFDVASRRSRLPTSSIAWAAAAACLVGIAAALTITGYRRRRRGMSPVRSAMPPAPAS